MKIRVVCYRVGDRWAWRLVNDGNGNVLAASIKTMRDKRDSRKVAAELVNAFFEGPFDEDEQESEA